jgi:molybdopterin converting factor small subunit
MRVTILYFGALKDVFGRTEEIRELPDGMTSGDLLPELFGGRVEELSKWRGKILMAVNCEHLRNSVALKDCDEVAVMPPLAGG